MTVRHGEAGTRVSHHDVRMGAHPAGAENAAFRKSISRLLISSEELLGPNLCSVRNARAFS